MKTAASARVRLRISTAATRGMTLVEIMVVVVIISLITAMVGTYVFGTLVKAQRSTTHTQLKKVAATLDLYRLEFRRYPSSAEGLAALTTPRRNGEPLMKELPVDAWDNEYLYASPGLNNPRGFDLHSMGEDELDGTDDDITNWTKFVE